MNNELPISGPLGLGDLLDRAFRLYRSRFAILLLTAAIFLVPLSLISGLISGQFITDYMDALMAIGNAPAGEEAFNTVFTQLFSFAGWSLLLGMVGLAVNAIVYLALTSQSIDILHGAKLSLGEGIRRGLQRFWAYVGMTIVQWLAIGVVTVAVMVPLFIFFFAVLAGGAAFGSLGDESTGFVAIAGVILLLICGYLFLLILLFAPTVYLSARWIAAGPTLIAEQLGPLEALKRSWRLTHGHAWRAIGYQILLFLITALVISLPVSVLQQLLLLLLPTSAMGLALGISTAFSSVFTVLWQPLYVAAIVLLYYDLRVRREGYDLDLRVAQLEAEVGVDDVGIDDVGIDE